MRIHTDKLTRPDLTDALPNGVYLEATTHGSRKRAHAFEVHLTATAGHDRHGVKRRRVNSGHTGAGVYTAATWLEWGDWMAELFKLDPNAIIGPYEGVADFVEQTRAASHYRSETKNKPGISPWAELLDEGP